MTEYDETDVPEATGDTDGAAKDDWVLVGEISSPFGIRGQVKMRALMDHPEALAKLSSVRLRFLDEIGAPTLPETSRKILKASKQPSGVTLTFKGLTDRNGAERLRGAQVFIRKSELPPLEPDAYYEVDLLGLTVVTESGKDLGVIKKVHFNPANDVYETEVALIPGVADVIVLKVDLTERLMTVRDMHGLRKDE